MGQAVGAWKVSSKFCITGDRKTMSRLCLDSSSMSSKSLALRDERMCQNTCRRQQTHSSSAGSSSVARPWFSFPSQTTALYSPFRGSGNSSARLAPIGNSSQLHHFSYLSRRPTIWKKKFWHSSPVSCILLSALYFCWSKLKFQWDGSHCWQEEHGMHSEHIVPSSNE